MESKTSPAAGHLTLPSLQSVLVIPFILQLLAVVIIIGYLSLQNGQKAVNDLAGQLQTEVSERIGERLDSYLALLPQTVQTNLDAVALGLIDTSDFELLGQFFWRQVASKDLNYLLFGFDNGDYLAAGHFFEDERIFFDILSTEANAGVDTLLSWSTNEGERREILVDSGPFNAKEEGWYSSAIDRGHIGWSPIYNWLVEPYNLSIAASSPVYDQEGHLLGVIAAEQNLSQISEFLRKTIVSSSGKAFIMERDGLLVAGSSSERPFKVPAGMPERLAAIKSSDSLIQASAHHVFEYFSQVDLIQDPIQLQFDVEGERHFLQVTPWQNDMGLDWLLVVVVPEADFMAQINSNTRSTIVLSLLALLLTILTSVWLSKRLSLPVLQLGQASEAMAAGDLTQKVALPSVKEYAVLAESFNDMAGQLKSSFDMLEFSASHDSLTGLPNRSLFQSRLEGALAAYYPDSQASSEAFYAVLFLDLDFFKQINDGFGHSTGDQLLVQVARRLAAYLRVYDTAARFGGDEFVILLSPLKTKEYAVDLAERILKSFHVPFIVQGQSIFANASIGIAFSREDYSNAEDVLRDADTALYQAKAKGKASFEIFDVTMREEVIERVKIETALRIAVEKKSFEICYQPIVNLSTSEVEGFEALLRWPDPVVPGGYVSPSLFIPIAEERGLIHELDWWVLRQVCQQMKVWQEDKQGEAWYMSVNMSSQQFLQANLVDRVEALLLEVGLQEKHLVIEITESTLLQNIAVVQVQLERLNALGIRLSIDDFGTGYSSLSYLQRFPIHTLKIDQSFVAGMQDSNSRDFAVVQAIVALAAALDLELIAEGVESASQVEQLLKLGDIRAQGYLFSRPMTANQINPILNIKDLQSYFVANSLS